MQSEAWFGGPAPCAEFPNDNPALHAGAVWVCAVCAGVGSVPSCELPVRAEPVRAEPLGQDTASNETDPPLEALELAHLPETAGDCDDASVPEIALASTEAVLSDDALAGGDEEAVPGPIEIVDEMVLDGVVDESGPESAPAQIVSLLPIGCTAEPETGACEDPFLKFVAALEETAVTLGAGEDQIACIRALFGVTRWDAVDPGAPAIEALTAAGVLVAGGARRASGLSRGREFTEQVLAWQGILRGESEDFALGAALDEWSADVLARVMGHPARAEGIRRELRRHGIAAFGLVAEAA